MPERRYQVDNMRGFTVEAALEVLDARKDDLRRSRDDYAEHVAQCAVCEPERAACQHGGQRRGQVTYRQGAVNSWAHGMARKWPRGAS